MKPSQAFFFGALGLLFATLFFFNSYREHILNDKKRDLASKNAKPKNQMERLLASLILDDASQPNVVVYGRPPSKKEQILYGVLEGKYEHSFKNQKHVLKIKPSEKPIKLGLQPQSFIEQFVQAHYKNADLIFLEKQRDPASQNLVFQIKVQEKSLFVSFEYSKDQKLVKFSLDSVTPKLL